jgi:hypothetical protein
LIVSRPIRKRFAPPLVGSGGVDRQPNPSFQGAASAANPESSQPSRAVLDFGFAT